MKNTNEQQYLKAIIHGDESAFEALFNNYFPKVKRFIDRLLHDEVEAEDLAQDLFVWIWQNRLKLDNIDNLNAYLFHAAQNAVYRYIRKELLAREYVEKRQDAFIYDNSLGQQNTEDSIYADELKLLIQFTVEKMPPQRRKIFQLSRNEGKSNEDIANMLLISKRTVENHLTLALAEIRKSIKNFFFLF